MAATDSYRLSVKESALPGATGDVQAIVPARALGEVVRISTGDSLEISVQENQVLFGMDGVWLSARRIDGQFPNYKQLLPQTFEHEIAISKEELLDVIRRTSLMAQRNLPVRLSFEEGSLEIGFNPDFLRDGVESVEGDTVRLKLISSLRPGLLQGDDGSFWYLIMPIRLPS
jgi:DNA polymerase-3 subunit beta